MKGLFLHTKMMAWSEKRAAVEREIRESGEK